MAARARVEVTENVKELVARSQEEKRLLELSKLGKNCCTVN